MMIMITTTINKNVCTLCPTSSSSEADNSEHKFSSSTHKYTWIEQKTAAHEQTKFDNSEK